MSLKREEVDANLYGDGDGHGGSWPSIIFYGLELLRATVISLTCRENGSL